MVPSIGTLAQLHVWADTGQDIAINTTATTKQTLSEFTARQR